MEPRETREGRVGLHVALRVEAAEMARWNAETISRFFGGIAMAEKAAADGRREARADSADLDTGKEPA